MAPALPLPAPLSIPQYILQAGATNRFSDQPHELEHLKFGYFGEIGGLLAAVKKSSRDQLTVPQHEQAAEELGDALWYLVGTAMRIGIFADDLGIQVLRSLRQAFGDTNVALPAPVTFRHLDGVIHTHQDHMVNERSTWLANVAQSAGVLAHMTETQLRSMSPPTQVEHLGQCLATWARTCGSFHLKTEDVARENLVKIASRWPGENPVYPPFFDSEDEYEAHERFPRMLPITFVEHGGREDGSVMQMIGDVFIGDRLTDNSNEPDGYRFHDVFHLAYVAHLGWSPVLRSLLKRKRKSRPKIDENEDGARAMIIEEGIATWIFNHAKHRQFYEGVKLGSLDYGLLKQIYSMVEGYEVDQCMLWQWERAILEGFAVFRELQKHRGGTVLVDMAEHRLVFTPPKSHSK